MIDASLCSYDGGSLVQFASYLSIDRSFEYRDWKTGSLSSSSTTDFYVIVRLLPLYDILYSLLICFGSTTRKKIAYSYAVMFSQELVIIHIGTIFVGLAFISILWRHKSSVLNNEIDQPPVPRSFNFSQCNQLIFPLDPERALKEKDNFIYGDRYYSQNCMQDILQSVAEATVGHQKVDFIVVGCEF